MTSCFMSFGYVTNKKIGKKTEDPKTFLEVFKNMDKSILKSKDSTELLKYFSEQAVIFRKLAESNYNESFGELDDKNVVYASMFLAATEQRELNGIELGSDVKVEGGDALSCLMSSLDIGFGVAGLYGSIKKMGMKTILKVVGAIFATYFSALVIAWEIYSFGECMGYW